VPVALDTARALAMARPDLMVTLTGLPRRWPAIRDLMDRFKRLLKRRKIRGHIAYHAEPNLHHDAWTTDGGAHCHAWWRGEDLTKPLRELASASGLGHVVDARKAFIHREGDSIPALRYGLKMILHTNPPAPTVLWPAAEEFLELNGGDLVHATQGFWQNWRGERLDLKEARVIARNGGRRPRGTRYVAMS
jgi:hypothetical protein